MLRMMLLGCVDCALFCEDIFYHSNVFRFIHLFPPVLLSASEILSHSKNDLYSWGGKFREILTRHLEHNATRRNDLLLSMYFIIHGRLF